ncbi:hypothetical protein Rsub_09401 [Raphidocelis subcapitata]|uniref:CBM20 domain-containing protein n=1 Tax=Raphidocelis subcapitata TaxID=307507 RepID=A0A2V0P8Z0_9CHLO|nr:hypothetical protein Rsub_09401 [Raphidocelis subcapitata]|eukprot:GBF96331.1 hypothetical protein Rsub_09401 [Raphidocelis subcapitata]
MKLVAAPSAGAAAAPRARLWAGPPDARRAPAAPATCSRSRASNAARWRAPAAVALAAAAGAPAAWGWLTMQAPEEPQRDRHPGGDAAAVAAPAAPVLRATFRLQYRTPPGAAVRICGDAAPLGAWRPGAALAMERCGGDDWVAHADLPAGSVATYKYVVVDAATARPLRWQEGPNLVLSLPPGTAAAAAGLRRIEALDSWCGRLQLRRAAPAQEEADRPRAAAPAGPWQLGGGAAGAPPGAMNNVAPFRAAPAQPAAQPAPRPAQQPTAAADARAVLPSLQQELEDALSALAARRGSGQDASDAIGAAVVGLRQLQSVLLRDGGPALASLARDIAALRGAFSPAASGDEAEAAAAAAAASAADDEDAAAAAAAAAPDGSFFGPLGWQGGRHGRGGAGPGGAFDPLVAALLSDHCELPCAFVHDALASASASADWPGDWPAEADAQRGGGGGGAPCPAA